MPFYLAIDAGGTKTRCLLADATRILARASTGTLKLMRVSELEATTRLHSMLAEVSAAAAVSLADIDRTCIGLAGLTIPAVRTWATTAITAKVAGDLILLGDEEIALDAAFQAGPGILVIAGTGSNVIGRAPDGTLHHAGGWGPILGDEGAGFWIGLEAIRAALRACDADPPVPTIPNPTIPKVPSSTGHKMPGAPSIPASSGWVGDTPSTSLLSEVQRHWNLDSLADLVAFANHRGDAHQPAPDFAALAPIVARCAEQGNPIATAILHRAGEDLANLITLAARKMIEPGVPHPRDGSSVAGWGIERSSTVLLDTPDQTAAEVGQISIAYTGSVLTHVAPVRAAMIARLAITVPAAQVLPSAIEPLKGALWRARQA